MKSIFLPFVLCSTLSAATTYILPGNSETGFWNLNRTNYNTGTSPAYPISGATSTPWGGPIAAGSTSATFTRIAGGGYFIGSGSGLYGSTSAAAYAISDSSPFLNLATLIFQARINVAPSSVTLSINGGAGLTANYFNSSAAGSGSFGPISDFGWQWDLSAIAVPINSYEIIMSLPDNSLVYGNQSGLTTITAGNNFVQVIPEPSLALSGFLVIALTLTRRHRA